MIHSIHSYILYSMTLLVVAIASPTAKIVHIDQRPYLFVLHNLIRCHLPTRPFDCCISNHGCAYAAAAAAAFCLTHKLLFC